MRRSSPTMAARIADFVPSAPTSAAPRCSPPFVSYATTPRSSWSKRSIRVPVRTGSRDGLDALEDRLVDVGAVYDGVRIAVARAEHLRDRDARDLAAVDRVHHHQLVDVDGAVARVGANAQVVERVERVGAQLDARAQLAQCRRLLQQRHAHADARERQRRREAADAAADDEDRRGIGGRRLHWRSVETRLLWHGHLCTAIRNRRPGVRRVGAMDAAAVHFGRRQLHGGNSASAARATCAGQCVMTTSTLQGACSINAGDVAPRHQRAAQLPGACGRRR